MKKVTIVILSLILFASALEAGELKGRFGVGLNWPGVQFRYCFNDSFLAEAKAQFSSNNILVGGRGCFLLNEIPGNCSIIPYVGGEYNWVLSQYTTGGYVTGGFIGAEALVTNHIGISGDAGLYYVNVWSPYGGIDDWGLIFNVGLTYYF